MDHTLWASYEGHLCVTHILFDSYSKQASVFNDEDGYTPLKYTATLSNREKQSVSYMIIQCK